ncbi:MAG: hypothetical protein ACK5SX_14955 [Sandaracinobacter sp.]
MIRLKILFRRTLALSLCSTLLTGEDVSASTGRVSTCMVTLADFKRNRTLSWADFDLSPDMYKGAMWLSSRGCYKEAVVVGRDYLAHGPSLSIREHAITTFHMARNAARAGDKESAALLAAASRRSDQAPDAPLDWNSYVIGFYGYLIADRALVQASYYRLLAKGGESNRINAAVLARTLSCFERSFVQVETNPKCAVSLPELEQSK